MNQEKEPSRRLTFEMSPEMEATRPSVAQRLRLRERILALPARERSMFAVRIKELLGFKRWKDIWHHEAYYLELEEGLIIARLLGATPDQLADPDFEFIPAAVEAESGAKPPVEEEE